MFYHLDDSMSTEEYMKRFRRNQNIRFAGSMLSSLAVGVCVAIKMNQVLPRI